ncbi:hypothetical protein MXB_4897 [Myxobolus squamalis]|nr:hypothetical protein MXB_4897 [Myxobolus squamalis]
MSLGKFITSFSLELSKKMLEDINFESNYCASTVSVYFALLTINIGTKGKSSSELASLLGLNYSLLLEKSLKQGKSKKIRDDVLDIFKICAKSSELNNKIFSAFQFNQNYINVLKDLFEMELEQISFQDQERATKIINSWVSDKTHGRIAKIIEKSGISADISFILINTIYFKSSWDEKFDPNLTMEREFFINSDTTVRIPMMHQTTTESIHVNAAKKFSTIIKQFRDSEVAGLFVLPDEDSNLKELMLNFTTKDLTECISLAKKIEVDIVVPKFNLKQQISIKKILEKMGIIEIFSKRCDFSNVSIEPTYVSDVIHSSNVTIDEEGVIAAAATAVQVNYRSFKPPRHQFIADRPFLFIIYEIKNRFPLFFNAFIIPE